MTFLGSPPPLVAATQRFRGRFFDFMSTLPAEQLDASLIRLFDAVMIEVDIVVRENDRLKADIRLARSMPAIPAALQKRVKEAKKKKKKLSDLMNSHNRPRTVSNSPGPDSDHPSASSSSSSLSSSSLSSNEPTSGDLDGNQLGRASSLSMISLSSSSPSPRDQTMTAPHKPAHPMLRIPAVPPPCPPSENATSPRSPRDASPVTPKAATASNSSPAAPFPLKIRTKVFESVVAVESHRSGEDVASMSPSLVDDSSSSVIIASREAPPIHKRSKSPLSHSRMVKRQPKVDSTALTASTSQVILEKVRSIFEKPSASLPIHKDLPRLIRGISVNGQALEPSPVMPQLSEEQENVDPMVMRLLHALLHQMSVSLGFEEPLAALIASTPLTLEPTQNEVSVALLSYLERVVGSGSEILTILKLATQSIIAPVIVAIKECLHPVVPTNSAPNGWRIDMAISPEQVVVRHAKREQPAAHASCFPHFVFDWHFELTYDRASAALVASRVVFDRIQGEDLGDRLAAKLTPVLKDCVELSILPGQVPLLYRRLKKLASFASSRQTKRQGETPSGSRSRSLDRIDKINKKEGKTKAVANSSSSSSSSSSNSSHNNSSSSAVVMVPDFESSSHSVYRYSETGQKILKLERLILSDRNLKSVPYKMLANIEDLQVLFLNRNKISSIDRLELFRLHSLPYAFSNTIRTLRLDHNRLTELPQEIGLMGQLEILLLQHNHLKSLPSTLGMLSQLSHLDVSHNEIATLPVELSNCGLLCYLQVEGNPLTFPDPSITQQGSTAILEALLQATSLKVLKLRHSVRSTDLPREALELDQESDLPVENTAIDSLLAIDLSTTHPGLEGGLSIVMASSSTGDLQESGSGDLVQTSPPESPAPFFAPESPASSSSSSASSSFSSFSVLPPGSPTASESSEVTVVAADETPVVEQQPPKQWIPCNPRGRTASSARAGSDEFARFVPRPAE